MKKAPSATDDRQTARRLLETIQKVILPSAHCQASETPNDQSSGSQQLRILTPLAPEQLAPRWFEPQQGEIAIETREIGTAEQ